MTSSPHPSPSSPSSPSDEEVAERLVPVWLDEAARNDSPTAGEAGRDWERRRLSAAAARELSHWITARVTDTAFNEDEGPDTGGAVRISVADKAAVHRWVAAQGHDV